MPTVDLSIIIVSWNVAELLVSCLDSIIASPVAINSADGNLPVVEIIVVDSASSDNSVEVVRQRYPQVVLLDQSENIGYTRGNNLGLERATGRHLLLLNPDTEIIADALPMMIRYLDENPDIGIIGPHTLNTDGSTQSTRRSFPTKALAFFESTWLQSLAPRTMLDAFYMTSRPDDAVYDVDWVQGSALMARREVYAQIGGLDTGYVMYSEELDWCKRAKQVGWRIVYLGTTSVTHHGGKSSEQASAWKHIHFQQSKIRYFRKHHGAAFAFVLRVFLWLGYLWQLGLESIKALLGHKREMRQQRIKAYWQVIRSGLKANS